MIRVHTPLRISLFGGGSDYHDFFRIYGGSVLTTAISVYAVTTRSDDGIITQTCPLQGCGLGSSAALIVGRLQAQLPSLPTMELAKAAIAIEQKQHLCGWQDQIIAAFGGFRWIRFNRHDCKDGPITMDPPPFRLNVPANSKRLAALNDRLLLFDTSVRRSGVTQPTPDTMANHRRREWMRDTAIHHAGNLLPARLSDTDGLDDIGAALHDCWMMKREIGASSSAIDAIYERGRAAGAVGGKLCGNGGGGAMLFYVTPERRSDVLAALSDLKHVTFQFESRGSTVTSDLAALHF